MKKLIIMLGLIVSMSANALELVDMSLGIHHVGVPSGIATSLDGRTHDNSDKYRQGYRTVNLTFDQAIFQNRNNLFGVIGMVSSGYSSEALQVQPYIAPKLYWVSHVNESFTFHITADLPIIGGFVSEGIWYDALNWPFSYATAYSFEKSPRIKLHQPDTITAGFTFKLDCIFCGNTGKEAVSK